MATDTDAPFTPAQRLNRGLIRTLSGPIDVARGAVGLTAQAISSVASGVKGRYRASKLRRDVTDAQNALRHEFAAAQDAVTSLPQTVAKAAKAAETAGDGRGRRRLWRMATAATMALAGGAATFSAVRRSRKPETSTLPPSVTVEPKP